MTPDTIATVKRTWSQVAPMKQAAGAMFYDRLFDRHPELEPMFTGDMQAQAEKLMRMVDTAVNALDRLDRVAPAIEKLGVRHHDYGVRPEHYDQVGAALLWPLRQGLGDEFTPEVEAAWGEVYAVLAETMQGAVVDA